MSSTILHTESKRNSEATSSENPRSRKERSPTERVHPRARYPPSGDYRSLVSSSLFFFSSPSSRNLFIRRGERCLLLLARGGGGQGFPGRRGWEAETGQSAQEGGEWRKERGRVGGGTNIGTSTAKSTRGFERAGCLIRSQRRQPGSAEEREEAAGGGGNRGIRGAQV